MTFPTPLLDARFARQKDCDEQARQQILQMTQHWLGNHAARYGIKGGYIFGSVTLPDRFSDRSDVDLAVETHKTGDICALMGDLSMHINRDVDLIPLDQCHFADKIRRIGLPWTQNASPG
ncbi:nucleotidyltransferase domain-containing protein [Leptolyngbya sp. BC1307]|uniref:nucleotidyltransferase family protein n=1 Tax=Leptolyngbya sp. BC1307 TaxID=2029589 RepID=UPI000EFC30BF|nr:nucleotidyltransferase domain-containing protein [Leptolyngbya sp. BC1307]